MDKREPVFILSSLLPLCIPSPAVSHLQAEHCFCSGAQDGLKTGNGHRARHKALDDRLDLTDSSHMCPVQLYRAIIIYPHAPLGGIFSTAPQGVSPLPQQCNSNSQRSGRPVGHLMTGGGHRAPDDRRRPHVIPCTATGYLKGISSQPAGSSCTAGWWGSLLLTHLLQQERSNRSDPPGHDHRTYIRT